MMTITITGAKHAPSWETLQHLLNQTTGQEYGRLVRIARPDGQCDYSAPGKYELSFRTDNRDIIPVNLEVIL